MKGKHVCVYQHCQQLPSKKLHRKTETASGSGRKLSVLLCCKYYLGCRFFQLYIFKDRSITRMLLRRAEQAGFKAVVLTVDAPAGLGKRETDVRLNFNLPSHLDLANLRDISALKQMGDTNGSALLSYTSKQFDATLTWDSLRWLQTETSLPIIVKGVMCAEDAVLAVRHGAAAVWVSNHGGRQLDGVPSTIEALPEVIQALRGSGVDVYLDGGIRRGTDVLKALALGAKFVFVGRPVLWGLAVAGASGVKDVLRILREELEEATSLSGYSSIHNVTEDVVVRSSIPMLSSIRAEAVAKL
eukprot:GHVS01030489.1.p1 GENE.GHVS01030489.1~~GHVS01030489.1.p1  ORF type:complete len:300 (-),score=25.78 GHVS01030489.1:173-1072(-)